MDFECGHVPHLGVVHVVLIAPHGSAQPRSHRAKVPKKIAELVREGPVGWWVGGLVSW